MSTPEEDALQRWAWVLRQVAGAAPEREAVRYTNPIGPFEHAEHVRALARDALRSPAQGGAKSPGQLMRWACWAQGVASAFGWLTLDQLKRMNMEDTWTAEKAGSKRGLI